MVMSSVEAGQKEPFELFHLNVYIPVVSPVTVVVGDAGFVITGVFGPLITDQYPEPVVIVLAAMVAVVTPHLNWSGPAAATVGGVETLICTSSWLLVHELFEMVHLKPYTPSVNPVMVELLASGDVIIAPPPPDTWVHRPVPVAGTFASKVTVLPQTV